YEYLLQCLTRRLDVQSFPTRRSSDLIVHLVAPPAKAGTPYGTTTDYRFCLGQKLSSARISEHGVPALAGLAVEVSQWYEILLRCVPKRIRRNSSRLGKSYEAIVLLIA